MSDLPECQVCSKIMTVFKAVHQERLVEYELGELSGVINMPCPHSDSIRKLWESQWQHNVLTPERWSVRISHIGWETDATIQFYDGEKDRYEIFVDDVELVATDEPKHPGTSILIGPQWIDPSVPKDWYSECLYGHGSCDEPEWTELHTGTNEHPDWLIDVMDQCVVPFSSDMGNYVTLSYTWGNAQCLKLTTGNLDRLRQPGSIHYPQAPGICQTVQDAIGVTKYLGERFLWVDSLCIIQDDNESLQRNINIMHRIYANSSLCLVAYAGTDANHGLRGLKGISAPRCVEQTTFDIAGGERLSCIKRPGRTKNATLDTEDDRVPTDEGSHYNDRGWTYQEFLFAKRRLIFTDGPLRWLCRRGRMGEETRSFLEEEDRSVHEMISTLYIHDRLPSLHTLDEIISDYNARHFTYQPDVLRAFLGIQNHLNRVFPGGLNYGHPEIFFDISLAWEAASGMTRRVSSSAEVSLEEDYLPSWSWMGWQGTLEFSTDTEFYSLSRNNGFTESVAEWFSMESPSPSSSNMQLVNCKWHHYKMLFERDPSQVPDEWEVYQATSKQLLCRIISEPETDLQGSRYPVPIPSPTDTIQPLEQRKFLFSKTSRCHFATKPGPSTSEKKWAAKDSVGLCSVNGEFAGFLRFNQLSEVDRSLAKGTAELVAVAKGWTTDLDDFLLSLEEQENLTAAESPALARQRLSRYRLNKGNTRSKCYFVLCIQWENGFAKRQASGKVLAEVWERNQEPVDLVLG